MNISVLPYNLPDFSIFNSQKEFDYFIWHPDKYFLVLGQSNKPEGSLVCSNVIDDNIAVIKRPSGGETVVVSPQTIIVSAFVINKSNMPPSFYFRLFNGYITEALNNAGLLNILQKGISDLSVGDKKILGSSIYRSKEKLFYHAVLNYSEETDVMEKYIAHPLREPDYRLGRAHSDFVTSLTKEGLKSSIEEVENEIRKVFDKHFSFSFAVIKD